MTVTRTVTIAAAGVGAAAVIWAARWTEMAPAWRTAAATAPTAANTRDSQFVRGHPEAQPDLAVPPVARLPALPPSPPHAPRPALALRQPLQDLFGRTSSGQEGRHRRLRRLSYEECPRDHPPWTPPCVASAPAGTSPSSTQL
nr:uncharacterized protein LOC113800216 [Penaeus vannamei]